MSHSQNNLTRNPRVKREMLTFTVTLERLPGKTRANMQECVRQGVVNILNTDGFVEVGVAVRLQKAETHYGADDGN